MVFLKEFFEKVDFEKNQLMTKNMKNYPRGKELRSFACTRNQYHPNVMSVYSRASNDTTELHSTVGSESDCISRGREFHPAQSYTLVEIDHEYISTVILLLPLIQEGLLSVTRESMHTLLVNSLVKLAKEKERFGELTVLT